MKLSVTAIMLMTSLGLWAATVIQLAATHPLHDSIEEVLQFIFMSTVTGISLAAFVEAVLELVRHRTTIIPTKDSL